MITKQPKRLGIKEIKPIIDIYLKELSKEIKLQKIILFGSYAKGKATKESDLDLVVISPDFSHRSFNERFSLLAKARLHPQTRQVAMDIFGYTPEEYASASSLTTLGEVKETGLTVFPWRFWVN